MTPPDTGDSPNGTAPPAPAASALAPARVSLRVGLSVALLAAAAFAWALADGGLVVTPQSLQHLAAADSLVRGEGYLVSPGNLLSRFPPLYATLLAPFAAAGWAPIPAVAAVNALGLALGLFAVYGLAAQLRVVRPIAVAAGFALLASNYYFLRAARPDGWMTTLCVVAAWAALVFCEKETRASWWMLVVATAGATLARYMAVFSLIPVIALLLFWVAPERRFRRALGYAAAAAAPVGIWLLRNRLETGFVTGMSRTADRPPSADATLLGNLHGLFESAFVDAFAWQAMGARHIVFDAAPLPLPALTLGGAALGLSGLGLALALAWRAGVRPAGPRVSTAPRDPAQRGLVLVTGCAVAYASALLAVWTSGNNDPINTRYVAPLYPFAALSVAALATRLAGRAELRRARVALAIFCIAVLAPNALKSISLVRSEPPSKDLIEVTSRRGEKVNWSTSLEWPRW